ncbi:hypothetical protein QLQ12_03350 [Actinoplanes sp. NEAU-A12]|uniref:Pyrrolo-quinoline quinone repeat domain-containing protein n=1 Tax=Actinoplanes sandaracinus TaxID=3045177 RepID=A0ABT6WD86_9ACTN|nr:PQQ-binding-like beta-propeller repeat protein [Actinoplanes sandaracinus]MDI6097637.1 hypothetical protein [Actinoplanes sandaracinus]
MPVDLDELLSSMHRQADAIPLGSPEQARRRGRRRSQARAMVSVAAAVTLAAAGLSVTTWRDGHSRQTTPPAATGGQLPSVGAPIAGPISYPEQGFPSFAAIDGERAYAAWADKDGMRILGADARTGAATWPAQKPTGSGEFGGFQAVAGMVMVSLEHNDGTDPDRTEYGFDGVTGAQRWSQPFDVADDTLFSDRVYVHMVAATGQTEGFDVHSGAKLWKQPAGSDRPVSSAVLYTPADEQRATQYGLPSAASTDRFAQVTRSGKVQVRRMSTGELVQSLPADVKADTTFSDLTVYDGWAYFVESGPAKGTDQYGTRNTLSRVHAVDLSGGTATSVVHEIGPGIRTVADLTPCGPGRVCVLEQDGDEPPTVAAVDVQKRRRLWRTPAPDGSAWLSSLGGRTLVSGDEGAAFYDENGRETFRHAGQVGWLDSGHLLMVMAPAGEGQATRMVKVTAATDARTVLGETPAITGRCGFTAERLACATKDGLEMWDLTG